MGTSKMGLFSRVDGEKLRDNIRSIIIEENDKLIRAALADLQKQAQTDLIKHIDQFGEKLDKVVADTVIVEIRRQIGVLK